MSHAATPRPVLVHNRLPACLPAGLGRAWLSLDLSVVRRALNAAHSLLQAAAERKKEGSSALDEFCRDLTAEAAQQRTDPVSSTSLTARAAGRCPILIP